jgi:hypothetical protein
MQIRAFEFVPWNSGASTFSNSLTTLLGTHHDFSFNNSTLNFFQRKSVGGNIAFWPGGAKRAVALLNIHDH